GRRRGRRPGAAAAPGLLPPRGAQRGRGRGRGAQRGRGGAAGPGPGAGGRGRGVQRGRGRGRPSVRPRWRIPPGALAPLAGRRRATGAPAGAGRASG
ncbi:unnamed protein product, partial [Bubo scandiacus]